MNESKEIKEVQQSLTSLFELTAHPDKMDFINHLALQINALILHDFNHLVSILYRIDIDEAQLKEMLQHYEHTDAGYIIAQLIIDRQLQKIQTRNSFRRDEDIREEDKW